MCSFCQPNNQKICIKCNILKPITCEFFNYRIDHKKFNNSCRLCVSQYHKDNYKNTRNKKLKYQKEYQNNNKNKIKEYMKNYLINNKKKSKDTKLKYNFGISLDDFNKMSQKQNNKCYICKKETKLCVDHNHNTGKIRKLLCSSCNKAFGFVKEDIIILENMIKYAQEHN